MFFGGNFLRRFAKAVLFSLAEGAIILVIVLFASASHIRNIPPGSAGEAGLGPVHLVHIEKAASPGGGYTLTYSFYKSLWAIFAACLALELLLLWVFSRMRSSDLPLTDEKV